MVFELLPFPPLGKGRASALWVNNIKLNLKFNLEFLENTPNKKVNFPQSPSLFKKGVWGELK